MAQRCLRGRGAKPSGIVRFAVGSSWRSPCPIPAPAATDGGASGLRADPRRPPTAGRHRTWRSDHDQRFRAHHRDGHRARPQRPRWPPDSPQGGRAVLKRLLKEGAVGPLFLGQTFVQSLRDVSATTARRWPCASTSTTRSVPVPTRSVSTSARPAGPAPCRPTCWSTTMGLELPTPSWPFRHGYEDRRAVPDAGRGDLLLAGAARSTAVKRLGGRRRSTSSPSTGPIWSAACSTSTTSLAKKPRFGQQKSFDLRDALREGAEPADDALSRGCGVRQPSGGETHRPTLRSRSWRAPAGRGYRIRATCRL